MNFYHNAMSKIYSIDNDFIIIGLTGRTGSGCSTVADILSSRKEDIRHSLYKGLNPKNNNERKQQILYKYFESSWSPFVKIQVSSILTLNLAKDIDDHFDQFMQEALSDLESEEDKKDIIKKFKGKLKEIKDEETKVVKEKDFDSYSNFFNDYLIKKNKEIRNLLKKSNYYIKLYQMLGNNYRVSGKYYDPNFKDEFFGFFLAEEINIIIRAIRELSKKKKKTYIVIDAIRNPFEATFFQDRYAAFYLMAISSDEISRQKRLRKLGLTDESIKKIDKKEYRKSSLDERESYIYQNISNCLELSDIYIENSDEKDVVSRFSSLSNQLIKFVSLMKRPGIITPTNIERCMQIAYTAKLNSGCISRQVGAAISDSHYSVKAIGWNDVPKGQVPCLLRDKLAFIKGNDSSAYSDFEKNTQEFIDHIKNKESECSLLCKEGMGIPFCFKTEWNEVLHEKHKNELQNSYSVKTPQELSVLNDVLSDFKLISNQVFTRSLHAEENAFLQISKYGGIGIEGGILFTTASPCELCSKKSYQLGIKSIYYIDPYPGIAISNIINSGELRPELKLFHGAIGKAFHNFYTPRMSYKDEISARIKKESDD